MSTYIFRASLKLTEHDNASILETYQISFSYQKCLLKTNNHTKGIEVSRK
jgi:hypothetical protein